MNRYHSDGPRRWDASLGAAPASTPRTTRVGNALYGVKWRNWKMMTKETPAAWGQELTTYSFPVFYDLHTDPKEEYPLDPRWIENTWMRWAAGKVLVDHATSLQKEPPIRPGTLDPYKPAN